MPPFDPPGCVPLICPAGTAIIMDMRVWHGGTANKSSAARPMLSVHYAGPDYSEDVLKDGGSIPFFGTAIGPTIVDLWTREVWKVFQPLAENCANTWWLTRL